MPFPMSSREQFHKSGNTIRKILNPVMLPSRENELVLYNQLNPFSHIE